MSENPSQVRRRRKVPRATREKTPDAVHYDSRQYSDEDESGSPNVNQNAVSGVLTVKLDDARPSRPSTISAHKSKILNRRDRHLAAALAARSQSTPRPDEEEPIIPKRTDVVHLMYQARRSLSSPRHKEESSESGRSSPPRFIRERAPVREIPSSPELRGSDGRLLTKLEINMRRFEEERRRFDLEKRKFEKERREIEKDHYLKKIEQAEERRRIFEALAGKKIGERRSIASGPEKKKILPQVTDDERLIFAERRRREEKRREELRREELRREELRREDQRREDLRREERRREEKRREPPKVQPKITNRAEDYESSTVSSSCEDLGEQSDRQLSDWSKKSHSDSQETAKQVTKRKSIEELDDEIREVQKVVVIEKPEVPETPPSKVRSETINGKEKKKKKKVKIDAKTEVTVQNVEEVKPVKPSFFARLFRSDSTAKKLKEEKAELKKLKEKEKEVEKKKKEEEKKEKELEPSVDDGKPMSISRFVFVEIWREFKIFTRRHPNEWTKIRYAWYKCYSKLVVLLILLGVGGMVFRFVEGAFENFYKCGVKRVKRDFIDILWHSSHNMREDDWKLLARNKLRTFEEELHEAHEAGMTSYSGMTSWNFINGVIFCFTVVTTIGYGHIAPVTTTGRAITIVYAIIGIPVFLILLADFGKLFTRCIKFVWAYVRRLYYTGSCRKVRKQAQVQGMIRGFNMAYDAAIRRPSMMVPGLNKNVVIDPTTPQSTSTHLPPGSMGTPTTPYPDDVEIDDEFNLPISVAVSILLAYILIGACMYSIWENWNFFEAFYFVFISMSTIGFGDYVPNHPIYMMLSIVYLIFGLALTSMCINVVQLKLSDHFKQASAKIGATIGLKMAEEEMARSEHLHTPTDIASVHSQGLANRENGEGGSGLSRARMAQMEDDSLSDKQLPPILMPRRINIPDINDKK